MDGTTPTPGSPIPARKWNRLNTKAQSNKIARGPNMLVSQLPGMTTVRLIQRAASFAHPFQCQVLNNIRISISSGTINGLPVLIGAKPMVTDPNAYPSEFIRTIDGDSYIALEVTCDDKWAAFKVEIVNVGHLYDGSRDAVTPAAKLLAAAEFPSLPGRKTRYPIAKLTGKLKDTPGLFQVTYHNLQHRAYVNPTDKAALTARHFFWPA